MAGEHSDDWRHGAVQPSDDLSDHVDGAADDSEDDELDDDINGPAGDGPARLGNPDPPAVRRGTARSQPKPQPDTSATHPQRQAAGRQPGSTSAERQPAAPQRPAARMAGPADFKRESPAFTRRASSPDSTKSSGRTSAGSAGRPSAGKRAVNRAKNAAGKRTAQRPKQPPSKTKQTADRAARGAGAAVARGLNAVGLPVSQRVGVVIVKAAPILLVVLLLLPVLLLSGSATFVDNSDSGIDYQQMPPADPYRLSEQTGYDLLVTATEATRPYNDLNIGPVPWSVVYAATLYATDGGMVSPFDTCTRDLGREPTGAAIAGVEDAVACTSDSPIVGETAGVSGPFLLYDTALPAGNFDVHSLDIGRGIEGRPSTSFEFAAFELDRIRRQMIDMEGWAAPVGDAVDDSAYADRFWLEAVSRLPMLDPAFASCDTPSTMYDERGVAADPDVVAADIAGIWRCELFRSPTVNHLTASPFSLTAPKFTPATSRAAAVNAIVNEALIAAELFSGFGTDVTVTSPEVCGRVPVGAGPGVIGGEPYNPELSDESLDENMVNAIAEQQQQIADRVIADSEPAGVFPMTKATFDTFNTFDGATRCDIGPNIHAAVAAFLSVESDVSRPGSLPEQAIGGWQTMPWVLGDADHIAAFTANGLYWTPPQTRRCASEIVDWVASQTVRDDLTVVDSDGQIQPVSPVDAGPLFGVAAGQAFPGTSCAPARLGEDLMFAAQEADGLRSNLVAATSVYTGPIDPGIPSQDTEAPATEVPAAPADSDRTPTAAELNLQVTADALRTAAATLTDSPGSPAIPGQDSIIMRLSFNGRMPATDVSAAPENAFARRVVALAVAVGGLFVGDDRVAEDPLAALTAFSSGLGLTAGLPATTPRILLTAVERAVANQPAGCAADVAFLLATAYEESGQWWDRIDETTGDMGRTVSPDGALGPFQFMPGTWSEWAADGNGDGDMNVHNVFDAAVASLNYQCWISDFKDFGPLVGDDQAVLLTATHYYQGAWYPADKLASCLSNPAGDCHGVRYGQKRLDTTLRYRAAIRDNLPLAGVNVTAGTPAAIAIAYALNQRGLDYCNDGGSCTRPASSYRSQWRVADGVLVPNEGRGYPTRFGPDAFDCSGLMVAAYKAAGIDLGVWDSASQFAAFQHSAVATRDLLPGDLLFFDMTPDPNGRIDHVAMYIGDGKMVHAANAELGVIIGGFNPQRDEYRGARRIPGAHTVAN